MPKRTGGRELFAETHLAERVAIERRKRDWTYAGLSARTKAAGCEIAQSALWKIENPPQGKPRRITVDELVVLARVFEMPMAELVLDPRDVVPGHLAELAERAAAALQGMYRLELEGAELARLHSALVGELEAGLQEYPDAATEVLALLDSRRAPEWVVGTEEYTLHELIRGRVQAHIEGDRA